MKNAVGRRCGPNFTILTGAELRIRGHLFFDASHGLGKGNEPTSGNPPRRSGWEIHPVYSIEVCDFKTLATCRFDREDVWTPLADWLLIE